ncbi:MAG: pilus assembly protein [Hamadaea sp.]|nr:pilus assembly protein [Hamadaea sp.]NUR46903.1 pilus assembly protein [Hamadaea sp.]NUT07929.1 pilus assembly protein [Hamadaea sp.]
MIRSKSRRDVRAGRRCDRGASAVEFALVLPMLLLLVFGIIDFGRLLNAQIKTTEAAREGARAATVFAGTGAQRRSAAVGRVQAVDSAIGVDQASSTFCDPPLTANEDATVHTTYTFDWITPVGDLAGMFGAGSWGASITVKGKGVMPCRA